MKRPRRFVWIKPSEASSLKAWIHWRCHVGGRIWLNRWFGFEYETYEGDYD